MTTPSRRSFLLAVAGLAVTGLAACTKRHTNTPTASASSAASPTAAPSGASPSATASSATPSATPTPSPSAAATAAFGAGATNVLVIGSDLRGDGDIRGGNSDVICVVQLTADHKRLNMVSFARDSLATLPNGAQGKMNSIYPTWGPKSLSAEVSRQLGGLEIHHVMEIGFIGFRRVVLLLEKVVVANKYFSDTEGFRFDIGDVVLPVERQALGALWFQRERKTLPNGDLDRTERQRATLTGLMLRIGELARTDEAKLRELLPALWRCMRMGYTITPEMAATLIPVVKELKAGDVSSVIAPVAYFDTVGGASVNILNAGRMSELAAALKAQDLSGYVGRYGTSNATTG